ncbi:hypothetical protein Goklo_005708, partial [Gossypium klotzschianum]|nr:hypothetical protein [Gossypium klotzschianum]
MNVGDEIIGKAIINLDYENEKNIINEGEMMNLIHELTLLHQLAIYGLRTSAGQRSAPVRTRYWLGKSSSSYKRFRRGFKLILSEFDETKREPSTLLMPMPQREPSTLPMPTVASDVE